MKATQILLILFLSLYTFNCSKSDLSEDCIKYYATVSDECNCYGSLFGCTRTYSLEKTEYTSLLKIQNESLEDCVYVKGNGRYSPFEGYLESLFNENCNEIDPDTFPF